MVFKKWMLVVAAVTLPAGFAMAGDAAKPKGKLKQACKSDIETMCPGLKKGKRAKCLRDNEAKLSPDCAKAVAMKPAKWGRGGGKKAEKAATEKPATE